AEALMWADFSASLLKRMGGNEAIEAILTNCVANYWFKRGECRKSFGMVQRAIALASRAYGPTHPLASIITGTPLTWLPEVLSDAETVRRAEAHIAATTQALGPHHGALVGVFGHSGEQYVSLGRLREAREHLAREEALSRELLPPDSDHWADVAAWRGE